MPSVLQQPSMALPRNSMVIRADTMPTGDAGVKIAAAIALLPAGIGGTVDATAFTNPQNLTGFTIPPGVTVQLSPVLYTMPAASPSIVVHEGGRLLGSGSNSPGSTKLRAFTNFNKALIQCISSSGTSGFWHGGLVQDLWLDGNKANQSTAGNCLEVYSIAERSKIQRLNISDAKQSGILISGSQSGTGTFENVTVNTCTTYGIELVAFRSALTMIGVGGDLNPTTFAITAQTGGGSLTLIDPKSEGATVNPVILFTGGSAKVSLTLVGGNLLNSTTPGVVIRIAANTGVDPSIQIIGTFTGNTYPTLIEDLKLSKTVTIANLVHHGIFSYHAGAITLDTNTVGTLT